MVISKGFVVRCNVLDPRGTYQHDYIDNHCVNATSIDEAISETEQVLTTDGGFAIVKYVFVWKNGDLIKTFD